MFFIVVASATFAWVCLCAWFGIWQVDRRFAKAGQR